MPLDLIAIDLPAIVAACPGSANTTLCRCAID